jgi:hypothetical protein
MRSFAIHIPGWVYTMTIYGTNKRDAVSRFRAQHGIQRMPKNYAIWEA